MEKERKILYSGMQATGKLTLGNYIGALKNWVNLNEEYDCFFGVMDLHSLTVRQNPTEFRQNARRIYTQYVAAGLDPKKNCIYFQSHVPAHAQLGWILDCFTYMGELNRMTQRTSQPSTQTILTQAYSPIPASWQRTSCSTRQTWCQSAQTRSSTWRFAGI